MFFSALKYFWTAYESVIKTPPGNIIKNIKNEEIDDMWAEDIMGV